MENVLSCCGQATNNTRSTARFQIAAVGDAADLHTAKKKFNFAREDLITLGKTQLLLPGLIDTHIHAPQYPNAGLGYDKPLLEWLDNYTYKLEKQYRDQELCKRVFDAVVVSSVVVVAHS
jgi:guanine deaminase